MIASYVPWNDGSKHNINYISQHFQKVLNDKADQKNQSVQAL